MANGIMDNVFNKLYNQDTIAKLEAQYGFGGSGLPSQARHQAALNELSKNLNIGNFGPGNLFTALAASATEIPDVIKTGDIKESARDVFDNLKGALATDKSKTPAEVYRDVYEGGSNQSGIVQAAKNVPSFLSDLIFTPAGAGSDVANLPSIDITNQLADARTIDEESALLDDAFEQQLAEATRTGKLGPLEGIIQNLNPKDAASFITSLLTGGASTALSGVASFADKLGIRRGMQEPPGAEGRGGYGVSRPGNTLTDQTRANRAEFTDFYSNFQGGAQHHMGKRVDDVINRTAQGRRTRSDAESFVNKYGSQEQKDKFNQAKAPKAGKGSFRAAQDEGTTGSSKIVCTMMNKSYGFGSFRNKIWMKFHKDLSPEYQKGYHKIFLPLVKIAKKNKIVKKILEHIAVHSTIDMRQSMRGKKHLLGRLYRKIILPICYWAGKK
tara:strand:+ start:41 stop:1363 length:1323 start_codon:yes stop_codon:yes gene_type:complete